MTEPRKAILLVEDNPDDEELVVHAFKKCNVDVGLVVAHDGIEALDYLSNHLFSPPAIVLLDLKMPRMDGLEVLRRLRETKEGWLVPVVVFTSSTDEGDVRHCYELGASSYIRKPIELPEFVEAIRKILNYWLDSNVLHRPLPTARAAAAHSH